MLIINFCFWSQKFDLFSKIVSIPKREILLALHPWSEPDQRGLINYS